MSQTRRPSGSSISTNVRKRLKTAVRRANYASRYHELRLKGKHPLRLLGTPKDPWLGSVAIGSHILADRFYIDGQCLRNPDHDKGDWPGGAIWRATGLDRETMAYLHSFCWLRDLNRVVDRKAARHRAMALTDHWLRQFDRWHAVAWAPDILGRRIVNWLAHAPLILDSADLVYRSKLLNCLARQARHLYHCGDDMLRGLPRLRAIGGLVMAGLYIPYGEDWLKKGAALLTKALAAEIGPDGDISGRNPEDLYRALRDLIMIRSALRAMGHESPADLERVIPRMAAMLEKLRHGDGKLALFNGAGEQDGREIAAALEIAATIGDPAAVTDPDKSSFRRLEKGGTVVIADMAPPPAVDVSEQGHAGTLSFEMSRGKQRIIVNCGAARGRPGETEPDLSRLCRSTAAHSTVVLNDKNSSEIRKDGRLGRAPSRVSGRQFAEQGHGLLDACHDGYLARFGLLHHRMIYLNDRGDDLRGEDILEQARGGAGKAAGLSATRFDVRFHLHPDIIVFLQKAPTGAVLRLPNGEVWQFHSAGGDLTLGESLYLGAGRAQKCRQIILSGQTTAAKTVIKWSLFRGEGVP